MKQNQTSFARSRIFPLSLAVLLCAFSLSSSREAHSTVLASSGKAFSEKMMPDFAGIDLSKSGSEVLSLDEIIAQAKPFPNGRVVLNFFNTGCLPCREGLKELQAHAESLQKEGVVVVLVSIGDSREKARAFLTKLGITFPCVWDKSGSISQNYGVTSSGGDFSTARVPLTAVGDNKGKLLRVITAEGSDYLAMIRKGK